MEIPLEELISDKSSLSGRTSAPEISKSGDASGKQNGRTCKLTSPVHSDSIFSSSSNSSYAREKRRKAIEETSLSTYKSIKRKGKNWKRSFKDDKKASVPPLGSDKRRCSSSGTDEAPSASDVSSKNMIDLQNPSTSDKIWNLRVNKENRRTEAEESDLKLFCPSNSSLNDGCDNETKRSFTPSENIPYRDRIRDRFNSVKERAVESVSRPQSRSQSRLKMLMMKQTGSKFEGLLKKEEEELNAAIRRHEDVKILWMDACRGTLDEIAYEEAFSFFTGTFEEGVARKEIDLTEEGSPSIDNTFENDSSGKVLTSELLGLKDDWELCEFKKAELVEPTNEKDEKNFIFCPSTTSASLEEKLEPGLSPRYLEDEGIYVGAAFRLSSRIKNKIERRLLVNPDGKKWFGTDGDIISRTNPLKCVRMRSYAKNEDERQQSGSVFMPATLTDRKNCFMDLAGSCHYILDIDISLIQFSHHPLFTREHVLAQRLKELFSKYKKRSEVNNLSRYSGRLEALRRTRDNMVLAMKEGGEELLHFNDILERYEDDIKEIRRIRNREGQMDKQLINRILMTWKDLKQMRELQGYRNTDIKLIIKKKITKDVATEKAMWDNEIKREAKEIHDEIRKERDRRVAAYREKHDEWIRNQSRKMKREMRTCETESHEERSTDAESLESSESYAGDDEKEEPKPPEMLPLSDIENEVSEVFKKCFRSPGESELEFAIGHMSSQDFSACTNKENVRRSAMKRQKIFVKLFYNGKEVCRSRSQPLSAKFNVLVSQRFAIRILEWPESFMIEIHEDSGPFARNLLVPGIFLPFPSCFTTVENSDIQKYEFSSKISVSCNHTGVGSGSNIIPYPGGSDYNNRAICLFTSGTIVYRMGWAENQGQILALPEKYWTYKREDVAINVAELFGNDASFDVGKLKTWINKSKIDPNDPQNSILFHYIQQAKDSETSETLYFRLDPLQSEFDFCPESEITDNVRFKLLNLRDIGEPEFRGMKMVPFNEKQIQRDVFRFYEKRISAHQKSLDILTSDPLDGYRAWGRKYLEQVHQKLVKECTLARQHRNLTDLVSEENVPDLGTLGLTFMKWLRPKRPLRPVRKERKRITPQNLTGQDIQIIVNVVRAFEVPIRKDLDSLSVPRSADLISLVNVRPFVEVSFQGITARTTAADGANPTWNQDLHIPLHFKNGDISHASLQSIKDKLYLHLFDEIIVDLIDDETLRETSIHQRFERHWLASMEIPFSTLYFNSRIEGTFKLYSPPVLLGYEREAHRRQFSGSVSQEPLLPQRDATYISLFVTVQPPLNPPDKLKEKLLSSETSILEKHLESWQREVVSMYPHRKVRPLVMDITGKTACIVRFIKPLCPPCVTDADTTPEMAARFVAMIPSSAGSTLFPGFFDIWLTADQTLRLLSGDSEDHALLLCSYFLHLGLESYVLLGSGIPHGSAAYVLVVESCNKTNEYYVWDATSGQKYNINDSFCPVQKIYCLFNDKNIWANIQAEEMPRRTRLDLTKRTDWFPAFGKGFSAPVGTVQPDCLEYRNTSRQAVDILQDKMEKRLRDKIMKWRKTKRTRWNRYCSGTLRKLLPKLEESFWNAKEGHTPDHVQELQHILASHKICGFPINMAYTDMGAVVEAVKATRVHCNENEDVEFSLSVYIHPYPNNVLSVWIYVASLVRRR